MQQQTWQQPQCVYLRNLAAKPTARTQDELVTSRTTACMSKRFSLLLHLPIKSVTEAKPWLSKAGSTELTPLKALSCHFLQKGYFLYIPGSTAHFTAPRLSKVVFPSEDLENITSELVSSCNKEDALFSLFTSLQEHDGRKIR